MFVINEDPHWAEKIFSARCLHWYHQNNETGLIRCCSCIQKDGLLMFVRTQITTLLSDQKTSELVWSRLSKSQRSLRAVKFRLLITVGHKQARLMVDLHKQGFVCVHFMFYFSLNQDIRERIFSSECSDGILSGLKKQSCYSFTCKKVLFYLNLHLMSWTLLVQA